MERAEQPSRACLNMDLNKNERRQLGVFDDLMWLNVAPWEGVCMI